MLPKNHRFSFKKGAPRRIYSTPLFVVRYDFLESGGLLAAVVVGKKVDKSAVVRNSVKRRIREIIKKSIPYTVNTSIVFFAKRPILDTTKETLEEEIKKTLQSIHILS